jgi:hypothetical protein
METKIEMSRMYDTLLATPGMNQNVKISLTISRKTALLLNQLIEKGLTEGRNGNFSGIMAALPRENFQELEVIGMELLRKADLTELSEKLKVINQS